MEGEGHFLICKMRRYVIEGKKQTAARSSSRPTNSSKEPANEQQQGAGQLLTKAPRMASAIVLKCAHTWAPPHDTLLVRATAGFALSGCDNGGPGYWFPQDNQGSAVHANVKLFFSMCPF